MNRRPLVSIIVPVHNAEITLQRCVESLIHQTYSNIEIILIENNSSDNSNKICDSFNDQRIVTVHSSKKGVSRARNLGLDIAKGDYLAFCDADDFYSLNHIEDVMNTALSTRADIIISGYYIEQNSTFINNTLQNSKFIRKDNILKNIMLTDYIMGVCWNKLFKASILKGIHFPDDMTILEDTYFLLKTLRKTSLVYYLAQPLYYYCDNPNSAVRNAKTLFSKDGKEFLYIRALNRIIKDFALTGSDRSLIKAKIFENAVLGKYLVVSKQYKSNGAINNINMEIKRNFNEFILNKNLSIKKKCKILAVLYFPWLKIMKDKLFKTN